MSEGTEPLSLHPNSTREVVAAHRERVSLRRAGLLLGLSLALLAPGPALAKQGDWARPSMQNVFDAMAYLLPRSIDPERFASAEERAGIRAEMAKLARAAEALADHGEERGAGVGFLSRSFAEDVELMRNNFDEGRYEPARYFLIGSINNCVACHSRIPSDNRFPMAEKLTQAVEMQSISAHERALLYVMTRRFDEAMTSWETALKDPAISPGQLDVGGVFFDYLALAVRGTRDYERARKTLLEVRLRKDLFLYMRTLLADWTTSLKWLQQNPEVGAGLEGARLLAAKAREMTDWTGARRGLVFDLAASASLNELTDRATAAAAKGKPILTPAELSEAYYLLGLIESRNLTGFWLDESASHLEAAVRADPSGVHAAMAFRLLEENMILGYGGSGGTFMPDEVWKKLEKLRALLDTSAATTNP